MKRSFRYPLIMMLILIMFFIYPVGVRLTFATSGDTTRISVDSNGTEGNDESAGVSISANGQYVVFESLADNLVSGDTNEYYDIFVRNLANNTVTRVSVNSSGAEGNSDSFFPTISADGRYVAFYSFADNLVSNDTNGALDVFVHDLNTNTTTRVSVNSNGMEGDDDSSNPSISADGRHVVFLSSATNLVSVDTNGYTDVFVYDLDTSAISRVSVNSSGTQGNGNSSTPSISADGQYVAFPSSATNLISGDTNGHVDIFLRNLNTNTTTRISVDSNQVQGNGDSYNPSISDDNRFVAFESTSDNLVNGGTNGNVQVFLRDLNANTITLISGDSNGIQGNGDSRAPSISANGQYIAFHSSSTNLVSGDTNGTNDVFVYDTNTNTITRVSVNSSGTQGNGDSFYPSISTDGRYIVFPSLADNLVSGDTNEVPDDFLHELDIAPAIVSVTRALTSPTSASSVNFNVTFSEPVQNVNADGSDFALTTTGVSNVSITGVSGSGSTYTISVDTGYGNGTIRLDIPNTATIQDLSGNPLSGLPFNTGETYEISKPLPDLIVTNAVITPSSPAPNTSFDVSITIKNQGGATGPVTIYRDVYIGTDPSTLIDSNTGCPSAGDFFRFDNFTNLDAGQSDTKTVTVTGGLPNGDYQLWVYVDSRCLVDEAGEANNGQ